MYKSEKTMVNRMSAFSTSKRAISPILATLLLIVIVVAASIAAYVWVQSSTEAQMTTASGFIILENVRFYGTNQIDITVRNTGTSDLKIDTIYINDEAHSVTQNIDGKESATFTVEYSWVSNTKYKIKVASTSGLHAESSYTSSTATQVSWIGDGSDGTLLVSSTNQIVNSYAYLTGNENTGETTITVSDATGFSADDEILVIQMQNSSGGTAGTYEFKDITSISGNDITLTASLDNSYYSGTFDSVGATASQIVRVPQYTTVTINSGSNITAPAWNGYTGGIVVFRAETVTVNSGGSISVSEKGYRGGPYGPSNNRDGFQGESYVGKGIGGAGYGVGKMNNAGGGGAYICGGGGEYGGGATDSDLWRGSGYPDTYARKGEVYGTADLTEIFFGSGGGGQWNGNDPDPSDGGDGGGIIIIYASTIVAPTDSFLANGETTNGIQYGSYSYGSSGGAGGSIYLYAATIQGGTNFCTATGGLGNHVPLREGGDGGVGRIRLDYGTLTGTTNPSPGYTGSVP